jgi:endonuclease YncB( thermonuclease family)
MTLTKKCFLTILIALVLLWPLSSVGADNLFTVTRVYDGDTIGCQGCGIIFRVRLAGIDAPEKKRGKRPEQPYAEKARQYLEKLVLGKKVSIKQISLDRSNFVLGIVSLERKSGFFSSDHQNINLEMVKSGFAEIMPGKHEFDIRPYQQAENEAKAKKLNMWSQKDYVSPREWRKKR